MDVPMLMSLGHYQQRVDLRHAYSASTIFKLLVFYKESAHSFEMLINTFSEHTYGEYDFIRTDWLRESYMSSLELGLPSTPETMLRLLSDRDYFESVLPIPIDSEEWGGASGTEIVRQWWLLAPLPYRERHLAAFKKTLNEIDMNLLRKQIVVHPTSGNRGFSKTKQLLYPDGVPGVPVKKPNQKQKPKQK